MTELIIILEKQKMALTDQVTRLTESRERLRKALRDMDAWNASGHYVDPATDKQLSVNYDLQPGDLTDTRDPAPTASDALRDDAMQWRDGSTIDEMDKEQP